MFDRIAPEYDRFNALASFGLHQSWRETMVRRIPPGAKVLDIATGTGDVAFLARAQGHEVVGVDFSDRMIARARAKDKEGEILWMTGSADALPFADRSFGCVTPAFALRNFRSTIDQVFKETFRVLNSGGVALHLDFGRPRSRFMRWGHQLHMTLGVPLIGRLLCGQRWPSRYLENTIDRFLNRAKWKTEWKRRALSTCSIGRCWAVSSNSIEGPRHASAIRPHPAVHPVRRRLRCFQPVGGVLIRFYSNDSQQKIVYECGMEPIGTPYVKIDIRFYLFALLFVAFDVEALFLYPWAVVFRTLGLVGFLDMMVFVAVLFLGLIYVWKRGALQWES